jgi:branched-chain amino acid transport system permease protein
MQRFTFWLVAIIALCIVPWISGDYTIYVVSLALIHIILAVGLNITMGYAGQVSLCHASFFGMGAYSMALLLARGWSFWAILPLSGSIAFVFGLIIGFPALKWRDHYLALITLAFNITSYLVSVQETEITGGPTGITSVARPSIGSFELTSDTAYYYLILFFTILAVLFSIWIIKSKWGRAFQALGLNTLAASAHGVNVRMYKLLAFAIGAFYAGVGGALFASLLRYVSPDSFTFVTSIECLIMIVVGGIGRIEGPIIGAILITVGPEVLRMAESAYMIIYSLLVILILIFMRKGLVVILDRVMEWIPTLGTKRFSPGG